MKQRLEIWEDGYKESLQVYLERLIALGYHIDSVVLHGDRAIVIFTKPETQ